jgi:hypothetical protein
MLAQQLHRPFMLEKRPGHSFILTYPEQMKTTFCLTLELSLYPTLISCVKLYRERTHEKASIPFLCQVSNLEPSGWKFNSYGWVILQATFDSIQRQALMASAGFSRQKPKVENEELAGSLHVRVTPALVQYMQCWLAIWG